MHALKLRAEAAAVEGVADALGDELGALSVSIEDADAGSAAEQPVFDEPGSGPTGAWRWASVEALFEDEGAALAAAAALVAAHAPGELAVTSIGPLDEHDWVRLTQAQFGPIEAAPGWWIVPSWAEVPLAAAHVIRLDPGLAFGTGSHPTTRMCLRWIVQAAAHRASPWPRVLDYGCGSGLLAITVARCGAKSIDAVDIDPAAVAATAANAEANGALVRAGLPGAVQRPYDLVVANILATPLKLLAPLLCGLLDRGGELVLSGILERQAGELQAAYAPWLALKVAARDDGWILLAGRRAGEECVA